MEAPAPRCTSTFRHGHGVASCYDLPEGHGGKHEGVCDLCDERGEYAVLHWTTAEQDQPRDPA